MLDDYAIFARIVESCSLSGAARDTGVAISTVSKRLSALEERLGIRLVQRTTRHVAITEAGQQFYRKVAAILAAAREAESMVANRQQFPSGPLRISSAVLAGRMYVSPRVPGFVTRYPAVQLELDLNDDFIDLRKARYDLAIRVTSVIEPWQEARQLVSNHRILCCTPSYLAKHGQPRTIAELQRHQLLGAVEQFPWRIDDGRGEVVVDGTSLVQTNSSEVVRDLLLGGLGIALRSPWDVADELRDGSVVRIMPQMRGSSATGVYAIYPRDRLVQPSVLAFIEHIAPAFRVLRGEPEPPTIIPSAQD